MALLAVPAALLWGVALAVGLILRDADTRHAVELVRVSGIVVRVRAAQTLAGNPAVPAQNPAEVYGEIEEAAAEALVAMRQLVGMLRSTGHPLPAPGSALGEVLRTAAGDRADVSVEDGVDQLSLPPELANALHRVVLEALTSAHRHAPHATEVRLGAWLDGDELVLDIGNDGVAPGTQGSEGGYGIVGMTERITTLDAGPRRGGRWHVTARLPLGDEETPFTHLSRGI